MRHLTPADYTTMSWANGRGTTTELIRIDGPDGLLWRLSLAAVVEDGPFSLFPGIERNLTVIAGPGFDLVGAGIARQARALVPIAFPGDVALRAVGTRGMQSDDFNVMTARALPRPQVTLEHDGSDLAAGGTLCLFALGRVAVNGTAMARHDLIITKGAARIGGRWPVIAVRLAV